MPAHHPPVRLRHGRGARTATVTATALLTAVAGHALGGAGLPEPGAVVLGALALGVPGWWLARAERGWERLAAAQLALQLVAHLVFEAAATHSTAGHAGAGPGLVLIAHLLSAALAAGWLRSGERRARALAERALDQLFALVRALVRVTGRIPVVAPGVVRRPARRLRGTILRHAIVHRGPPRLS